MNSSMKDYLTNSSLFKNNQKNRLVSSYVTHKNYFAEDKSQSPDRNIHSPDMTNNNNSKRGLNFIAK
jgi:hypothetical protein